MLTVYDLVHEFCLSEKLSAPSQNDLRNIGKIISCHFKRYWGIEQTDEVISRTGFVRHKEAGRLVIVVGYPDEFGEQMISKINIFFAQKAYNKEESNIKVIADGFTAADKAMNLLQSDGRKKRKRVPVPVISVKPPQQ